MSRSKDTTDFIQVIMFLMFTGGSLIIHAFRKMRLTRKIEDTPTARIASAPQGSVEFQGYAWPVELLQSPLTMRPCVYFKFTIEEERRSKNNSHWVKVFEYQSDRPFGIVDKTGYAVIFPSGAEVNAMPLKIPSLNGAQIAVVQALLNTVGSSVKIDGGFFSSKKRFTENALFSGSPLYALGSFRTVSGFRPYNLMNGCEQFMTKITEFNPKISMVQGKRVMGRENSMVYMSLAEECGRFQMRPMAAAAGSDFSLPSDNAQVMPGQTPRYTASAGMLTHTPESPLYVAGAHQNELLKQLGSWNWIKIIAGAILLTLAFVFLYRKYYLRQPF